METKDKAAVSAAQLELGDDTFSLSPMDKGTASFAGGQAGCIKPVVTPDALSGLSLPIDGLADDTQEVIQAYADGYQCNRDFVTAAVFAAVSAAVGKKIRTHDGRYENQLSLFVCLVAPSGSNKTTPVREILRPLSDRDAANYKKFKAETQKEKIPHVGWNSLTRLQGKLFNGLAEGSHAYFVHSYYVPLDEYTTAQTEYILPFSAAIQKGNFHATQFHPEKSGSIGEQILKNFLEL